MSGVRKVNPNPVYGEFEQIGKKITWLKIAGAAAVASTDLTDSVGAQGAIAAIYKAIQLRSTIIAVGPIAVAGMSVAVEGDFGYEAHATGDHPLSFIAEIEAEIQALGATHTSDVIDKDSGAVTVVKVKLDSVTVTSVPFNLV